MKILVIANNTFSTTQNNGKTLSSILDFVKQNNLAQLYFGTNEEPDYDICNNYYRITEIDIFKSIIKFNFKSRNTHKKILINNINDESYVLKKIKRNAKSFALIREILWSLKTWKTKELYNWIEEFKPDLIFSVLGNGIFAHKIVIDISKKYNIPFVTYFTDDYYINDNSTNILQRIHHKLVKKQYTKTLRHASLSYVISESMKKDYERIFKRKFGIMVNGIDFDLINEIENNNKSNNIIISYIGGLHLNRWKSIIEFSEYINKLSVKHNLNIEIQVFSALIPYENVLIKFKKTSVKYLGFLSPNEVKIQIAKSDFLLHVESFDEKYRLYTKYSVSTKIPECLSSNKLLIVYGPNEVASIKLVSENKLGCVLTDLLSDKEKLNILEDFILNRNNKQNLIHRAYDYSFIHFNKKRIQDNFIRDIHSIV